MTVSAARNALAVLLSFVAPLLYFTVKDPNAAPRAALPTALASTPQLARLQAYLHIRTDHPRPHYLSAASFLNATAHTLLPNASVRVVELAPSKPLFLLTLPGYDRSLSSLLLNSHTDVVPAEESKWTAAHPFSAAITDDARVYARGAQDMKSVGMQYLEALSQLLASDWRNRRTVHVSFVPDEEIGGKDGMARMVSDNHQVPDFSFADLNVGVALDEGEPSPTDQFHLFYGERNLLWLELSVSGPPGHGATFPNITAAQTLHAIVARALALRDRELHRLATHADVKLGDVTSINVAYMSTGTLSGTGYAFNVIPSMARAGFDIRFPPTVSPAEMEAEVQSWLDGCCPEGSGVNASVTTVHKTRSESVTSTDPEINPFIVALEDGMKKAGVADNLEHGIFFASTDARYLREVGVPCFGFSPIRNTVNRMHKHDEFISIDGYLKGIDIYKSIIRKLADFDTSSDPQTKPHQVEQTMRPRSPPTDAGRVQANGDGQQGHDDL